MPSVGTIGPRPTIPFATLTGRRAGAIVPLVMFAAFVVSTVADGASPVISAALPLVATFASAALVAVGPSVTPPTTEAVAVCSPLMRVALIVVALITGAVRDVGERLYVVPRMLKVRVEVFGA